MEAALVMFRADGQRRIFRLDLPVTVLGRKPDSDLRIPHTMVSRQHARIEKREEGLFLRDLDSSNGTFHNGRRVVEAKLAPADRITIGPVQFTVLIDGEPIGFEPHEAELARGADLRELAASGPGGGSPPGRAGPWAERDEETVPFPDEPQEEARPDAEAPSRDEPGSTGR